MFPYLEETDFLRGNTGKKKKESDRPRIPRTCPASQRLAQSSTHVSGCEHYSRSHSPTTIKNPHEFRIYHKLRHSAPWDALKFLSRHARQSALPARGTCSRRPSNTCFASRGGRTFLFVADALSWPPSAKRVNAAWQTERGTLPPHADALAFTERLRGAHGILNHTRTPCVRGCSHFRSAESREAQPLTMTDVESSGNRLFRARRTIPAGTYPNWLSGD